MEGEKLSSDLLPLYKKHTIEEYKFLYSKCKLYFKCQHCVLTETKLFAILGER